MPIHYPHNTSNHSDMQATITSIHKHKFLLTIYKRHTRLLKKRIYVTLGTTFLSQAPCTQVQLRTVAFFCPETVITSLLETRQCDNYNLK